MNNQNLTEQQLKQQKVIKLFDKIGLSLASAARAMNISREQLNFCLLRGEASNSTAQKLAAALSSFHKEDFTDDVFAAIRFDTQKADECDPKLLTKIRSYFERLRLNH